MRILSLLRLLKLDTTVMKNATIENFTTLQNPFTFESFVQMKCWENTHRALVDCFNAYNDADSVSRSYKSCTIKGMIQVLEYSDNQEIKALASKADFVLTCIS